MPTRRKKLRKPAANKEPSVTFSSFPVPASLRAASESFAAQPDPLTARFNLAPFSVFPCSRPVCGSAQSLRSDVASRRPRRCSFHGSQTEEEDEFSEDEEPESAIFSEVGGPEGFTLNNFLHTADCTPSTLLPTFTLGDLWAVTRTNPRLTWLPTSLKNGGPNTMYGEVFNEVWGPESCLYGKLVLWTSRTGAAQAKRRKGVPSAAEQTRVAVEDSILRVSGGADQHAGGAGASSSDISDPFNSAGGADDGPNPIIQLGVGLWKFWRLPRRRLTIKSLRWPWLRSRRRPGVALQSAAGEAPLSWPEASMLQMRSAADEAAAWILQMPLAHALYLTSLPNPLFTFGPRHNEVISPKKSSQWAPKLARGNQLAVYTLPGMWMVLPSTKGYIRFSPYFLSGIELLKTWEVVQKLRLKAALHRRENRRRRLFDRTNKSVALWAARNAGFNEGLPGGGPTIAPPESVLGGEEEPEEMKDFIQELGFGNQAGAARLALPPAPLPIQILGVVGCGAVTAVGRSLLGLAVLADKAVAAAPLGRMLFLGLPEKPLVQRRALKDVAAEIQQHNYKIFTGCENTATDDDAASSFGTDSAAAPSELRPSEPSASASLAARGSATADEEGDEDISAAHPIPDRFQTPEYAFELEASTAPSQNLLLDTRASVRSSLPWTEQQEGAIKAKIHFNSLVKVNTWNAAALSAMLSYCETGAAPLPPLLWPLDPHPASGGSEGGENGSETPRPSIDSLRAADPEAGLQEDIDQLLEKLMGNTVSELNKLSLAMTRGAEGAPPFDDESDDLTDDDRDYYFLSCLAKTGNALLSRAAMTMVKATGSFKATAWSVQNGFRHHKMGIGRRSHWLLRSVRPEEICNELEVGKIGTFDAANAIDIDNWTYSAVNVDMDRATGVDKSPEDLGNDLLRGMVLIGELENQDGSTKAFDMMTIGTTNAFWLDSMEWP